MAEREVVTFKLPLSLDTAARVMQAMDREFPGCTLSEPTGDVMSFTVDPESRRDLTPEGVHTLLCDGDACPCFAHGQADARDEMAEAKDDLVDAARAVLDAAKK